MFTVVLCRRGSVSPVFKPNVQGKGSFEKNFNSSEEFVKFWMQSNNNFLIVGFEGITRKQKNVVFRKISSLIEKLLKEKY